MPVTRLRVERTQWAVGNGFFHSGRVQSGSSEFAYVYDCGALSPAANQHSLTREIDELAARLDSVACMFVSHFDYDHVSGIPHLAAAISISQFVIPLTSPAERLLLFTRSAAVDPSGDGPGSDPFYRRLTVDPVDALRALGSGEPAEVVTVQPGQESAEAAVPTELLPPTSLAGARDDEPIAQAPRGAAGVAVEAGTTAIWEWFPYVARQARNTAADFVRELVAAGLIAHQRDLDRSSVLHDLVLKHQRKLIAAYDAALKRAGTSFTRNLSSLMLYSGPVPGLRYRAYRSRPYPVERAEHGAWDPKPGWLGLGDADLRAQKRVVEVSQVFAPFTPLVGTFAPSHHGSRLDWSSDLLREFDQDGLHVPTFVFSASGAYRSRRDKAVLHPDGDVLLEINEFGGTAVIVGLSSSSRWTELLQVFIEH